MLTTGKIDEKKVCNTFHVDGLDGWPIFLVYHGHNIKNDDQKNRFFSRISEF